jgi:hypothetical protein
MPSTFTGLGFEMQAAGEGLNVWGAPKLNGVIARINYAIAGYLPIAITGDYTPTSSNSATLATGFEARNSLLKFTGTLAANATITMPGTPMQWMINNATNKTLTITTGSGSTVTVEAGDTIPVYCDGTNVRTLMYGAYNLKDYIASVSASAGAVPGTTGNLGKFLKVTVDAGPPTWQAINTTDLGDYLTNILGKQVALAVSL